MEYTREVCSSKHDFILINFHGMAAIIYSLSFDGSDSLDTGFGTVVILILLQRHVQGLAQIVQ